MLTSDAAAPAMVRNTPVLADVIAPVGIVLASMLAVCVATNGEKNCWLDCPDAVVTVPDNPVTFPKESVV